MSVQPPNRSLFEITGKNGIQVKIVSIEHVGELETEIMTRYQNGLLNADLYDAYLATFDFACQQKFNNARSLIIATVPQPQIRITFYREDRAYPVIVPPTYYFAIDNDVADLLKADLEPQGYRLQKVRLPDKLIAVRSGLAQYGKNNITYVEGMGSFQRPVAFISDYPCAQDSWGNASVLESCDNCSACRNACPTGAIASDRFQLYAERCLTFHNERTNAFPQWLSPSWHNCLVGCMICQKVCPANKDVVKWIKSGATFDNEETDLILAGVSKARMAPKTLEKLKRLDLLSYYDVLPRNLRALIENSA
jgi:epoxyqueuosine reductase